MTIVAQSISFRFIKHPMTWFIQPCPQHHLPNHVIIEAALARSSCQRNQKRTALKWNCARLPGIKNCIQINYCSSFCIKWNAPNVYAFYLFLSRWTASKSIRMYQSRPQNTRADALTQCRQTKRKHMYAYNAEAHTHTCIVIEQKTQSTSNHRAPNKVSTADKLTSKTR